MDNILSYIFDHNICSESSFWSSIFIPIIGFLAAVISLLFVRKQIKLHRKTMQYQIVKDYLSKWEEPLMLSVRLTACYTFLKPHKEDDKDEELKKEKQKALKEIDDKYVPDNDGLRFKGPHLEITHNLLLNYFDKVTTFANSKQIDFNVFYDNFSYMLEGYYKTFLHHLKYKQGKDKTLYTSIKKYYELCKKKSEKSSKKNYLNVPKYCKIQIIKCCDLLELTDSSYINKIRLSINQKEDKQDK